MVQEDTVESDQKLDSNIGNNFVLYVDMDREVIPPDYKMSISWSWGWHSFTSFHLTKRILAALLKV